MNYALNLPALALCMVIIHAPAYASGDCGPSFAKIAPLNTSHLTLDHRIEHHWHEIHWERLERKALPSGAATPIELGHEINKLNTQERQKLIKLIKKNPAPYSAKEVENYLLLALGDLDSWDRLLQRIQVNKFDKLLLNYLSQNLTSIPNQERAVLFKKIDLLYSDARMKKHSSNGRATEKRALDFLIRHLLPPKKMIDAEIKAGATATQAWDHFLNEVHRALPHAQTTPYGSKEVLNYAQRVQKILQEKNWNAPVMIGGSLPSGRAVPKVSDIDIFYAPYRGLEEHLPVLRSRFENGPLEGLEPTLGFLDAETITALSRLSPVFVRVTKEKIELVIYPVFKPLDAPALIRARYPTGIETVYPLP